MRSATEGFGAEERLAMICARGCGDEQSECDTTTSGVKALPQINRMFHETTTF
ncbi:hypothetical protein [Roseovarius aestuariivivens]|uniref:hypothetical protein n=1 Tax=Roseovarius aestuariivivens TaxID=1888910 RepID=UPI0014368A46|nr:hypothetical protein [Roseovarius aestuariivivens]